MIQGNNEWLLEDLFFAVNDQSNLVIDGILWKLFKFDIVQPQRGSVAWVQGFKFVLVESWQTWNKNRENEVIFGGSCVPFKKERMDPKLAGDPPLIRSF